MTFPSLPGAYVVRRVPDGAVLYVGVAATQSIADRWKKQHLYPRSGGSALRRTLGVHLGLVAQKLRRPDRYYPPEVELEITRFLSSECSVESIPAESPQEARRLEAELIRSLNPLLNVRR